MKRQKLNWANIYDGGDAHKIIKNLYNKKDYEELHIALWTWLSLDGTKGKWEWFEQYGVPRVSSDCFACEESGGSCYYCPLTKPTAIGCLSGVYDQWCKADFETRKSLAERIASMEWKK